MSSEVQYAPTCPRARDAPRSARVAAPHDSRSRTACTRERPLRRTTTRGEDDPSKKRIHRPREPARGAGDRRHRRLGRGRERAADADRALAALPYLPDPPAVTARGANDGEWAPSGAAGRASGVRTGDGKAKWSGSAHARRTDGRRGTKAGGTIGPAGSRGRRGRARDGGAPHPVPDGAISRGRTRGRGRATRGAGARAPSP